MAIDVDWAGTATNPYRIFVPRADLPIVQASPEIRELDVNQFRKDLRSAEAAAGGAPWPETHRHQGETTLSGNVFARFVEILPPYLVEFEDGQYSVRAVGANHNLLDVKVNNQVSLSVFLSAGLINASSSLTAADIANAVWEEPASDHVGAGTLGQALSHLRAAQVVATGVVQAGTTSRDVVTDIVGVDSLFSGLTLVVIGTMHRCARIVRSFTAATSSFNLVIPLAWTPEPGDLVFITSQRSANIFGAAR